MGWSGRGVKTFSASLCSLSISLYLRPKSENNTDSKLCHIYLETQSIRGLLGTLALITSSSMSRHLIALIAKFLFQSLLIITIPKLSFGNRATEDEKPRELPAWSTTAWPL